MRFDSKLHFFCITSEIIYLNWIPRMSHKKIKHNYKTQTLNHKSKLHVPFYHKDKDIQAHS